MAADSVVIENEVTDNPQEYLLPCAETKKRMSLWSKINTWPRDFLFRGKVKGPWLTVEFLFYQMCFLAFGLYMIISAILNSEHYRYLSNVTDETQKRTPLDFFVVPVNWFFGLPMDLNNGQYRAWRASFVLYFSGIAVFLAISHLVRFVCKKLERNPYIARLVYYTVSGFGFVFLVHGVYILWFVAASLLNFILTKLLRGVRGTPLILFVFNTAILIVVSWFQPNYYVQVDPQLGVLDVWPGVLTRWTLYYRMTVLRMISFAFDHHWQATAKPLSRKTATSDYDRRKEEHHATGDYNLLTYYAYLFYLPLFIAGPIITFNDFVHQLKAPLATIRLRATLVYLAKVAAVLVMFDTALHLIYYDALFSAEWTHLDPMTTFVAAFWGLHVSYYKFYIMWRSARGMALLDTVDPPENMLRWVNNNYCFQEFWRGWHASYNQWAVRYMYIPLGGRRWNFLNVWVVFVFIGMWHDLRWKWIAWAVVNCAFLLAEVAIVTHFSKPKFESLRKAPYFHLLCAAGAGVLIFFLIFANVVLATALDNSLLGSLYGPVLFFYRAFIRSWGPAVAVTAYAWFFVFFPLSHQFKKEEKQHPEKSFIYVFPNF